MNILGIIPARYASSRFPGKPLFDLNGKSMIQRVYEQACKASLLSQVVVATDDQRIFDHVIGFGGKAVMTSSEHRSGTDRCAEVLSKSSEHFDAVINIQGDEPFIQPEQIDLLARLFEDTSVAIGTLIKPLHDPSDLTNPNIIKVVIDTNQNGIYFSRSPIPFVRDAAAISEWPQKVNLYKHIGIYGYRADVLPKLTQLAPGVLEIAESLEQLRWRENGYLIRTALTQLETISIDAPEDVDKLRKAGLI
jgi:3-deoxy-manno-octulosonate cytidylyltransferase (CMP-KDO synthetase)